MKAVVLGCGPSGLIAAHTAALAGADVSIVSFRAVKSPITGAQYLHAPIRMINGMAPDRLVTFKQEGDQRGYAQKVYDDAEAPCSWASFPVGKYPMWSLRETYNKLWRLYADRIREKMITAEVVGEVVSGFDVAISTIPAYAICLKTEHSFDAAHIWIRPEAPEFVREGEVMYSGDPTTPWYRASRLDGIGSTEYGHRVLRAVKGTKPLDTDCDCHPDVVRAGRFGMWKKGVLLHHVQDITRATLNVLREGSQP